jgi:hypothetical protein
MKKIILLLSIPLIMTISLVLASTNLNAIYGQQNQTTPQSDNQTSNLNIEDLIKFSNNAVIAFENDNDTAVAENLVEIQDSIINSTGKQVIRVPADAIVSN